MQKPKYIFSVVTLSLFGIIGGYLYLSQESTQFSLSSRSNESDLVSRLRTFSGADSKWGQSPFSSGTPVVSESKEDSSPNIPQPNTLWETKTRQINGKTVTYVFGEGNPKEVALTGDALKDHWRKNGKGYMTPEAEMALKAFLSNPSLPYFINKCFGQIDWHNKQAAVYHMYPQNLSIEYLLYIDPETGRKEFRYDEIQVIAGAFNGMDNPLEFDESKRTWNQCLSQVEYTQHFLPLVEQFFWVWKYYGNQWETR